MSSPLPDVPFWQRQNAGTAFSSDAGTRCRLCTRARFLWIDGTGYVWEICRYCDVGRL